MNIKKRIQELSLDQKAKLYFMGLVRKGVIDTLPEDPKAAYVSMMMDKDDYGRSISGKDKRTFMEPEDRATRADKMMSGEYEDEDYKDSKRYADVRADLENEIEKDLEESDATSWKYNNSPAGDTLDLAPRKVGKSVKEQYGTHGGYVELMDLDDHLDNIHYEFEMWSKGPSTEMTDIEPAKEDVIKYVVDYLRNTL